MSPIQPDSIPNRTNTDSLSGLFANRYAIMNLIATGGMGSVYRVKDLWLNEEVVALKFIHWKLANQPLVLERFRREVTLARKLSHPNIIKIYDMSQPAGADQFLTMEYVSGRSVRECIDDGEHMHWLEHDVLRLLFHVTLALDHAHRLQVIHRDVKPENVLISDSGEVKLIDFGVAREVEVDHRLTPSGRVTGTIRYMPPEVFKEGPIDQRLDLYSVGVLAFEMVTGSAPFDGNNSAVTIAQHLTQPVPHLASYRDGTSEWLQEFIETCMEKDARDRYQSASEAARAIIERLHELGQTVESSAIPADLSTLMAAGAAKRGTRRWFFF